MLRAHGITDKGRVRPTNEDCFGIAPDLQLCVVADGMGGHNAGEVAAQLAVDAITDYIALPQADEMWPFGYDDRLSAAGNLLRTAVYVANIHILEAAVLTHAYSGMGTTIVAALVRDGRLSVAHVGDSRLYLRRQGKLRQLTVDDSWMASMMATDPQADHTMLQHHPMRHALTNVVGVRTRTEVHVMEESLTGGEILALTTDGVHGVLDEARIQQLMDESACIDDLAPALVRCALARGSRDNCTAVVAEYRL
jgi:protein phosphatase